jgi:phage tail sheath protein FI
MPEYLYPGVYVEEVDTGNKPIEGVSTSTVGFLGITERGPLQPTLITSFTDFTRTFGSYVKDARGDHYLAYAVEGFFQNGGDRCFVTRVASSPPSPPPPALQPSPPYASLTSPDGGMQVQAVGPGDWGNKIAVQTARAGLQNNPNLFRLLVGYWVDGLPHPLPDLTDPRQVSQSSPTLVENFDDLSAIPANSTFYESQVNDVSNLITLKQLAPGVPVIDSPLASPPVASPPASPRAMQLQGGTDGPIELKDFTGELSEQDNKVGLLALGDVDEISILCCPDEFYFDEKDTNISNALVAQCETLKYRFAILQASVAAGRPENNDPSINSPRGYAAFYFPWLQITNPISGVPLLVPPGGHIAGIYARSDTSRGVHKDPANEIIRGISRLQLQINNQQQAILNPKGVNCLRNFKGLGNLVWGGRTTSPDPDWKYINVRRLFIFVEKSIDRGTQWVVFEPNDEALWARARRSVGDFLTRLWMDGMLQGATKEQAYFVRCDRTTMTQADLDNGRFIMLIGIAPVKPAEFVIFRIGQYTGGSDVTEG